MTNREIVKKALITAIQYELSLLDSHCNVKDDPDYQEFIGIVKQNIKDFSKVLKERYDYKT